jgi:threonine-phosphate decarboxylase
MAMSSEQGINRYRLAERLKVPGRDIIDFSNPVNPLGTSKKIKSELRKHLKYLLYYPDPQTKRLREQIASYHGIDPEMILCGNGSTEIISLLVRAINPSRGLFQSPSSPEYEKAFMLNSPYTENGHQQNTVAGARIVYATLHEDTGFEINPDEYIHLMSGKGSPDTLRNMAFLSNPNNLTGRILSRDSVLRIAEAAIRLGWHLVVDEAFIDFCAGSDASVLCDVRENPNLIVLRTFSHFHALAGLRLGYGVFSPELAAKIKKHMNSCNVNSLAQRAAIIALKDSKYREETAKIMKEEKLFLEKKLKKLEMPFFPSDANYYLLKTPDARAIYRSLQKKGILLCDCSDFAGCGSAYLRIAVKSHKENAFLMRELESMLKPSPTDTP